MLLHHQVPRNPVQGLNEDLEALGRASYGNQFERGPCWLTCAPGDGRTERLYGQAEEILASALKEKDRRSALLAIRTAVSIMAEARSYLQIQGELTHELGWDRNLAGLFIQLICPSAPSPDLTPTFTFVATDRSEDAEAEETGLLQRP